MNLKEFVKKMKAKFQENEDAKKEPPLWKRALSLVACLATSVIFAFIGAEMIVSFTKAMPWMGIGWLVMGILLLTQHIRYIPGLTALLVMDIFTTEQHPISQGLNWQWLHERDVPGSETDIQALTHTKSVTIETGSEEPVTLNVSITDIPSIKHLERFRIFKTTEERQRSIDAQIESYLTVRQTDFSNREDVMQKVKKLSGEIEKYATKEIFSAELKITLDHFHGLEIQKIAVDVMLPKDLSDAIVAREANKEKLQARKDTTQNQKERADDLVKASGDILPFKDAMEFVLMTDGANVNKNINEEKKHWSLDINIVKALGEVISNLRGSHWSPEELNRLSETMAKMTAKMSDLEEALKGR